MQRCLQLARMGAGAVAPNPMVGAVLVYNDVIIGEGYHRQWGGPHAEVECIRSVTKEAEHLIAQATLYVSLEPCAHFGKTPPCADLIIVQGIQKVVVGCRDPFSLVAGKGIEKLKAAGVEVVVGVLEKECIELNRHFFTYHTLHRPYITLKWAQTANGYIANGNFKPLAISNAYTARLVHRWRSQHKAIMVGTNTALFDDPQLTTRYWPGQHPLRVVVDKALRLPASLRLFDGQHPTLVFNCIQHSEHYNLTYYQLIREDDLVQQMVKALYNLKVDSLLVEGGAQLLQSFIDAGLWDEAIAITAESMNVKNGISAPQLHHHQCTKHETVFSDTIRTYTPHLN
jgi:diaminohydroxyphosphoribosylaminopyrimidine deaminase/5-amino-6-(5-phosphoribosylamino)uracil reductase